MHSLLRVSGDKLRSRGIASQKARTGNLLALCPAPPTLADLENALISRCARGSALLPPEALAEAEALANRKYRTWAWNHGSSPAYDLEKRRRFAWGEVAIHLQTAGGVIQACRISGDFFSDRPIEELAKAFVGLQFSQKQLAQALCSCQWEDWFAGCDANAMRKFFLEELFS